jgi:uncharacterized membrane protein
MEVLYVVLFIVVIIMLIGIKNSLTAKTDRLETKILELQRQLQSFLQRPPESKAPEPAASKPVEDIKKPEPVKPTEHIPPANIPEAVEWQAEVIADSKPVINRPIKTAEPFNRPLPNFKPAEPRPSFFERHPDLEKFIGENLVPKIGIAILVLAIGFFVKYAIDNNWIGPVGRVGIGVLCGGILIGVAHRLRKSYTAFSSVLVGGGLAVLYFTITLAYHQFYLFNQTAAFIILIVITCFAVALSMLYDRQELAVIALIGGLSSPFMVSSGNANYHALFIYLVILNAGLLIIAYNKTWRVLNISAFVLTVLVFSGALYTLTAPTYSTGLLYGSVLYLMFFAINVANNVKENKKFISADFTILLINTGLYFGLGLYLLTEMHLEHLRGLFSAGLGLINLVISFVLFRNKKVDTNVLYLLIGITLTFISLTAPIQLHGHNITLFWAAETVLLYWLFQKSGITLMKLTSAIVWVAMLISLFIDLIEIYSSSFISQNIIANKGFITTVVASISSGLLYWLANKSEPETLKGVTIKPGVYKYAALLLLFLSGLLEINHQFLNHYPGTDLNSIYLMLYIPAFVFVLYMASKKFEGIKMDWIVSTTIFTLCGLVYLVYNPYYFDVQYAMLVQNKVSAAHFTAHWIGAIFMGLLFYQFILIVKNSFSEGMQKAATWFLSAAIVIFLSIEGCLLSNMLFYSPPNTLDNLVTVYIKTGLPILWGLISFAMMWLGMRNKARTLRIVSLTLFTINLVKLFVFDIRNIPPAGKIAAFFCLGVLLLIISFMYQKVKKIIVEDEKPKQES